MEEAARPAEPDDLARAAELYELATAELRAERGGDVWARHSGRPDRDAAVVARLETLLADPAALALVGTLDGVVVGYALVRAVELSDGSRLADLTDVYVEPEGRQVGIAELLLDAVLAWARQQGCFGVDAVALPGMRETKNFFEAAGLTARAIVVHKRL
ncbi:MAG: GNAT family N-acetyltransferase [Acidimicrobiales bacterium]